MSVRFLSGVNVDSNTLFVDDVNNRVGIGTSQPSTNLNVVVDPNGGNPHTYSRIHLKGGTYASMSIGSPTNGSAWYMFGDTDDAYVAGMAYEHATDSMYFNVNNATALYINSSRNVGIGTTSPAKSLHVQSSAKDTLFYLQSTNTTTDGFAQIQMQAGSRSAYFWVANQNATSWGGDGSLNIYTTDGAITWWTAQSQKMILTTGGNVGIGTTSPASKLHVAQSTGTVNELYITQQKTYGAGTGTSERAAIVLGISESGIAFSDRKFAVIETGTESEASSANSFLAISTRVGGVVNERMRITSTGNVGIGTTNPASKFVVSNGGAEGLEFAPTGGTGNDAYIQSYNRSTSTYENLTYYANNHYFNYGGTTNVIINSSGNVGIGTTGPSYKLQVSESDYARISLHQTTTGALWQWGNDGSNMYAYYTNTGVRALDIKQNGNVGIGTTSPVAQLDITKTFNARAGAQSNPTGGASVAIDYQTSSDIQGRIRSRDWDAAAWKNFTIEANNILLSPAGNVGIGTTSPNHKLDIYSNENVPLRIHRPSNANLDSSGAWGIGFSTRGDAINSTTDTRAGIFSYYNGNLFLAAANTSIVADPDAYARLTVLNTGYVGIGTTSPLEKLDVRGSAYISGYTVGFDTNPQGNYAYRLTNDGGNSFLNLQGGNVGIGTDNPDQKLVVNGSVKIGAAYYFFGGNPPNPSDATAAIYDGSGVGPTLSGLSVAFRAGTTTPAEIMRVTSTGLGIGTTSPQTALHVGSTGTNAYSSTITSGSNMKGIKTTLSNNADDMVGIYFATGTNTQGTHWSGITGSRTDNTAHWGTQLNFYTHDENTSNLNDATQKMVIKGSGNVGINTDNPLQLLHLSKTGANPYIRISADAFTGLDIGQETSAGNGVINLRDDKDIRILTNGADVVRIKNNGNVLIGTTSDAGHLLYVNGTSRFNGVAHLSSRLMVGITSDQTYASIFVGGDITAGANQYALLLDPQLSGTNNYGLLANARIKASHAADNAYGVYIINNEKLSGASIVNNYGLFIANQTSGSSVNYALYSAGGTSYFAGNVGIGTTDPTQALHVDGSARVTGAYYDSNNEAGTSGQVLSSTGSGTDWVSLSEITGVDGTGTANYIAKWSDADTITDSQIRDDGTTVGIGGAPNDAKLYVAGAIQAGGKTTYTKYYSSLDTTGVAVAGISSGGNGQSAGFIFTCFGGNGYQKIVYNLVNAAGVWSVTKNLDEGVNAFDVAATTSDSGASYTFTFKARSSTQYYTPFVTVEVIAPYGFNTSYL